MNYLLATKGATDKGDKMFVGFRLPTATSGVV